MQRSATTPAAIEGRVIRDKGEDDRGRIKASR
jgi:hypothetical protein